MMATSQVRATEPGSVMYLLSLTSVGTKGAPTKARSLDNKQAENL